MSILNFLKKIDYFCPVCKKLPFFELHLILFHPAVGEPLSGLANEDGHTCPPVGREGRPYVSQITVSKEFHLSL
jgi:hypothetical protein